METQTLFKILYIISFIILFVACGFIMAQSYLNFLYSKYDTKKIIIERLVYEQFSHEIYSNINSKIIEDIQFADECENGYEIYQFPIKIESFYDCTNINEQDINKNICQNKITPTSLCCRGICCINEVSGKEDHYYCRDKNNINEYDSRNNVCSKFSKYNGKFYINEDNKKICVKKVDKTYEDLLLIDYTNYPNLNNNLLYQSSTTQIKNYVVKNIFSINPPSYFETESNIKISLMLNKKNYDEDKIKKRIQQISDISAKDIYDTFFEEECSKDNDYYQCYDPNYRVIQENIRLDNIISNNKKYSLIFDSFKYNDYIKSQTINWYSRGYITFQNRTELDKFKKIFDSNDHKNNPLYKISKDLYPNLTTFILGIIFECYCIVCICLLAKELKNDDNNSIDNLIYYNYFTFLSNFVIFLIYLFIYIFYYLNQFEEINIDMETFYQKVLQKYNYRRKQLYLVIGIIILSFNIFLELLIQNLKFNMMFKGNKPSGNTIEVRIQFKNYKCPHEEHKFKLYLNKKFNQQIDKIKKLIYNKKCINAEENEIKRFLFNDNEIDGNKTIKEIKIKNNELIEIEIEDF